MSEGSKEVSLLSGTTIPRWVAAVSAAALSLLAIPSADLWESLSAPPGWAGAGVLGIRLWQMIFDSYGFAGISALKGSLVIVTVLLAGRGLARSERASFIIGGAAFGALLPWGPDLLLFPLLAGVFYLGDYFGGRGSNKFFLISLAMIFALWPSLDRNFWLGAILFSAGSAGGGLLISAVPLLAPLLNPVGLGSLADGGAFVPLLASWVGHPGFAASLPGEPRFWLTFLAVALSFNRAWKNPNRLARASISALAGLAIKMHSALPAMPAPSARADNVAPGGESERSAVGERSPILPSLLYIPLLLWFFLTPPPSRVPQGALAALETLKIGNYSVETEPEWRADVSMWATHRGKVEGAASGGPREVIPAMEAKVLLAFRHKYPGGLVHPFEMEPEPDAGVLLMRARYPMNPSWRRLQRGWHIVSAGNRWVLFCKETPENTDWLQMNSLKYYSPYLPLPPGPNGKRAALTEVLKLLNADPNFFPGLRDAGRMETDLGMLSEAEVHLVSALRLQPKNAEVWNDMGVALQMGGKGEEAKTAYLRSITLNPVEILPRLNLAGLYAGTGSYKEAEMLLSDILAKRPSYSDVRRMLAKVLKVQGRSKEAAEIIKGLPPDQMIPEDIELLGGETISGVPGHER